MRFWMESESKTGGEWDTLCPLAVFCDGDRKGSIRQTDEGYIFIDNAIGYTGFSGPHVVEVFNQVVEAYGGAIRPPAPVEVADAKQRPGDTLQFRRFEQTRTGFVMEITDIDTQFPAIVDFIKGTGGWASTNRAGYVYVNDTMVGDGDFLVVDEKGWVRVAESNCLDDMENKGYVEVPNG